MGCCTGNCRDFGGGGTGGSKPPALAFIMTEALLGFGMALYRLGSMVVEHAAETRVLADLSFGMAL